MNLRQFGDKTNEMVSKLFTSIGDLDAATCFMVLLWTPIILILSFALLGWIHEIYTQFKNNGEC